MFFSFQTAFVVDDVTTIIKEVSFTAVLEFQIKRGIEDISEITFLISQRKTNLVGCDPSLESSE